MSSITHQDSTKIKNSTTICENQMTMTMSNGQTRTDLSEQLQEQKSSKPILYYVPIRGIAQPIRNIMHYMDIDFEEVNFNSEEEYLKSVQTDDNFTDMFGLPKITHEGRNISEVVSICRYLCLRYQRNELLGRTPQVQAQVNEILIKYINQKSKMMRTIFRGIDQIVSEPKKKLEIQWKLFKQILQESSYIQGCLKLYLKSKNFLLNQLTLIDFFFYEACFYISNFFGNIISYHPIYNNIKAYKDFFENMSFYNLNKTKIEEKRIFLRVNGQKHKRIITSIWDDHTSALF